MPLRDQSDREWTSSDFGLLGIVAVFATYLGWTANTLLTREAISREEAARLAIVPRESVAFPGQWHFGPFICSNLCEGHQAGFEWAQRRALTKEGECYGNSTSFVQGCLVYLQVVGHIRDQGL